MLAARAGAGDPTQRCAAVGLGAWHLKGGAGMKGRCPVGERLKRLASRATSENQRGLSALEEKTTSLW